MGYRSIIKVVAKKNSSAEAELRKVGETGDLFDKIEEVKLGNTEVTVFSCDWIKWYEEDPDSAYDDVREVMRIVRANRDDVDFGRIGEDADDEFIGKNGWLEPQISVNIAVCDGDGEYDGED